MGAPVSFWTMARNVDGSAWTNMVVVVWMTTALVALVAMVKAGEKNGI